MSIDQLIATALARRAEVGGDAVVQIAVRTGRSAWSILDVGDERTHPQGLDWPGSPRLVIETEILQSSIEPMGDGW